MWTFHQETGQVEDFKGFLYGRSYAGHGEGKNNPALQDIHGGCRWEPDKKLWLPVEGLKQATTNPDDPGDCGPLPRGIYIINPPVDTEKHGPFVMWLTPTPDTQMFGRSGMGWHGDSIEHPGLASLGCICSPRILRQMVWKSDDHRVQVVQ